MAHFVSASCLGENCIVCKYPAAHKVGEEILHDDPDPIRHNLTAYVCCEHFGETFGVICIEPIVSHMWQKVKYKWHALIRKNGHFALCGAYFYNDNEMKEKSNIELNKLCKTCVRLDK